MTISNSPQPAQSSLISDLNNTARYALGNRFGLLAAAALVLGFGAYFNWGWLVAAGIAPVLLRVAPCAAMCALGMCTMGMTKTPPTDAQDPKLLSEDGKTLDHKDCC